MVEVMGSIPLGSTILSLCSRKIFYAISLADLPSILSGEAIGKRQVAKTQTSDFQALGSNSPLVHAQINAFAIMAL